MAALGLALELLVRAAAVYVVVLMLPLAFAAMVWPARRVWATRMVELLVSLILSKFVIVAVLSLAAAAFASSGTGISQLLTAMALLVLSTFAPWTLMRILPFTEVAAGAAGLLRHELPQAGGRALGLASVAGGAEEFAAMLPSRLQRQAQDMDHGFASYAQTGATTPAEAPPRQPGTQAQSTATEPETGPAHDPGAAPNADGSQPAPNTHGSERATTTDERPAYVPPSLMTRDEPVPIGPELLQGPFDHQQPESATEDSE
jgi:hypothetical protein